MKYSIVATVAFGLIGSANSAPVAPQGGDAPAKRLYPYPYGYPYGLNLRQCSADEDCNEGHYCITETGRCSFQTREAVMAQEEESTTNEKRNAPHKDKRIIPPPYYPYDRPSYLDNIQPVKKGECTSDADCEGDHYCVTETETCSIETREAVMADQNGAEKREVEPPTGSEVKKRFILGPPGSWNIPPPREGECTSDADCEGDHYCVTELEICSEQTREEAMAE